MEPDVAPASPDERVRSTHTPPDDLARTVAAHLRAHRWADAHDAIGRWLALHPEHTDAHALQGDVFRDEWKLDAARASFERALALDRSNAQARAGLAFVQIVTGRIHDGITNCRLAMQARSDLAAPHRHLVSALIMCGQAAEAARHALEARRLAPLEPENTIVLAAAWFRAGLHAGAVRLIERAIARDGTRAEAWTTRAAFRFAMGETAAAEADLARAFDLKPWLPPAHALAARLHAAAGRMTEAMVSLGHARARNPASEEYLLLEAGWLAAIGRRAGALAICHENWWRHPRSRELRSRIVMWSLEERRIGDARRFITGVAAGASAAALWRRLGDVWMELGAEYAPEALHGYMHAERGDRDPALGLQIAELLAAAGRLPDALARAAALAGPKAAALAAEWEERLGRPDDALARLTRARAEYPDDGFVAMRLGMALRTRGMLDDAEPHARRAAELAPDEPAAAEQLAILLSDRERFDESLAMFRRAAELSAGASSVRFNLAILLARQRRWVEAEHAFRHVLAVDPLHVESMAKLAHALTEQKRWAEAIEWLEHAAERAPNEPGIRELLIFSHRSLHHLEAAADAARRWVDDAPRSFAALAMLARQLAALKDPDADRTADRAWDLSPESTAAMEMRADVAAQFGRYREAVDWLDRALLREPDNITLLTHRGFLVQEFSTPEEGEHVLRRVLALAPDAAHAPMNLALLSLRQGAYDEGWRLYETRDSALRGPNTLVATRDALGRRPDLSHASVFVRAEQGLGDTLQFMRYVRRLAAECRDVAFQVPDAIMWAARGLAPNVRVFGYDEAPPAGDFQTALLSLPHYYETTVATIPADVPYVAPDAGRVARWRARIGEAGFRIGICWHTNPAHGNARRWIPLRHLAPLAAIPGVRLISLQKFHGLDQLAALPAGTVETLGDRFDDGPDAFADTAAVMSVVDLVITIDTSIAHLAGAMARPAWVLLHRTADWRWLTGRDDTPWYPTLRLVRQRIADDWDDVGARLLELGAAAAAGAPGVSGRTGS